MSTHLISLYFDDETNDWLEGLIYKAAEKTGNSNMTANEIPPHITVGMVKGNDKNELSERLDKAISNVYAGKIEIVSVGLFRTSVVFLQPVLNKYLYDTSVFINDLFSTGQSFENFPESRYTPHNWIPHITIAKRLSEKEQLETVKILQSEDIQRKCSICSLGLAEVKPYKDVKVWNLSD